MIEDDVVMVTPYPFDQRLVCPRCAFDYVHIRAVRSVAGGAEIDCWGECDHAWTLVLIFHKGQVFLRSESIVNGSGMYDEGNALARVAALEAAALAVVAHPVDPRVCPWCYAKAGATFGGRHADDCPVVALAALLGEGVN